MAIVLLKNGVYVHGCVHMSRQLLGVCKWGCVYKSHVENTLMSELIRYISKYPFGVSLLRINAASANGCMHMSRKIFGCVHMGVHAEFLVCALISTHQLPD